MINNEKLPLSQFLLLLRLAVGGKITIPINGSSPFHLKFYFYSQNLLAL